MIRRLDVMSRRRIRQALVQWHTLTIRCAMQFTRLSAALPSDRDAQDRAMYRTAVAAVVLIAAVRLTEGSL
jgi:hypothetical protein